MPTWEETKRAAQTAFISQGNGFQAVDNSVSDIYQQILSKGHIYPWAGAESLTQHIAEGNLEPPEVQRPEISRSVEQEQDVEPER